MQRECETTADWKMMLYSSDIWFLGAKKDWVSGQPEPDMR